MKDDRPHRDDGGDDIERRYRDASAELDERPDESARRAILAAAAREVRAKPTDAATYRRARPRWPLAAAAAVMLSTLAVMMALRTEEEMPQFGAAPEPARTASADAAPASSPAEQTRPSPSSPPAESSPPAAMPVDSAPVAKRSDAAPLPDRRQQARSERQAPKQPRTASVPAATEERQPPEPTARARDSIAEQSQPAAPSPPAAPPPVMKERAEEQEARAPARALEGDREEAARRKEANRPSSSLGSLGAAQNAASAETAATWLERIIKLRRDGRHDEADVELKRFRERYPQVQVPAEALPVTGTR